MSVRLVRVAVAVLAGCWLLVLALDVGVPLDVFRTSIEASLSRTLGQAVSIEGPIAVRPTPVPSLTLQDLSIAVQAGRPDRLRAGQVEARLGLFSLLSGRPRPVRLEARDVTIYLEQLLTGDDLLLPAGWLSGLELSLHNLVLSYRGIGTEPPLRLGLERLTGNILPGQPLQLVAGGRLGAIPYAADLTLPPVATLLHPGTSWHWQAGVELAGDRFQLQGTLQLETDGQAPLATLELQGGPAAVADTAPEIAAGAAITGKLSLHLGHGRPQLGGELLLSDLDPGHMAGLVASEAMPAGASGPVTGWLNGVDADLALNIENIRNLPVTVRETRVKLALRDGKLSAPLETVIAGVPFQGSLRLDTPVEQPAWALSLAAADVDVARLLEGLPAFAAVGGEVEGIELHATMPAGGKAGVTAGLAVGVQVNAARLSYGNTPDGLPVPVVLDELSLLAPADGAVTMAADGALAGAPFDVGLTGGSLALLLQGEAWPVSLHATGGGATLTASGDLASLDGNSADTLNLEVSGERLGSLAPWFGVAACATTPFTLRGQLVLGKNVGRLQFIKAHLGDTRLAGELDWSRDEQVPLLHTALHVDTLYPADVAGLMPVMSYAVSADMARGIRFDMPILAGGAVIANADIDLTVAKIAHRLVDISAVSFSGQLRDGLFRQSPFRARIGGRVLEGQLDTSGKDTGVAFEISADEADSVNLVDRLFSSAIQWVGNAGVVPLRWLFGAGLPLSGVPECEAGGDEASGPGGQ